MSRAFEARLALFSRENPRAAVLLARVNTSALHLTSTLLGEPNLLDTRVAPARPFHDPEGAQKESDAWVQQIGLAGISTLVIFGIGLGYAYRSLVPWLAEDRRRSLVFLEHDLAVLGAFLETPLAGTVLNDPQVHLYFLENSPEGGELLKGLAWATYGKKMAFVALPCYATWHATLFSEVESRILYEMAHIHGIIDEYMDYGVSFFQNFWHNIFLLPGSRQASGLKGAFRGLPAIIVAAGPSLGKQLDQLKGLTRRALLLSGGSAINALSSAGIVPHLAVGIDPNAPQYLRARQQAAFEVPLFFRSRLFFEALTLAHGPKLYLRGGDGYNLTDWIERKLHVPGSILGGGHSVANFCIEIAHYLGCSPIILVGFDLAYGRHGEHYAPGVEASRGSKERAWETPIEWHLEDGTAIQTQWKWLVEAHWIEDFAKRYRRVQRHINATEGGLPLRGIANMTLEAVSRDVLTRSFDIDGWVHTAVAGLAEIRASPDKLLGWMAEMFDSLFRAHEHISALIDIIERAKRRPSRELRFPWAESPEAVEHINRLHKEIAFRYILDVFDRMRTKLDFYAIQHHAHPKRSARECGAFQLEMAWHHFWFLREVAVVNQILIGRVVKERVWNSDVQAFSPKHSIF